MARKAILETGYTFTPGASGVGSVVIPRAIPRERLVLITNVTTNTVIYNFSDANLKATTYTVNASNYQMGAIVDPSTSVVTSGTATTTVVLNYNTTGMSSTDKLQITVDEYDEKFTPSETFQDPVSKMRVSTPQALIDTDFEYSVQPTKWEGLSLVQNYPSFYNKGSGATAIDITAVNGGGQSPLSTITITTVVNTSLVAGDVITVRDTTNQLTEGTFIVDTAAGTSVTYTAKGVVSGGVYDSGYTTVYGGGIYSGAQIPVSSATYSGTTITVNTTSPHGLHPGTPIMLRGVTATTLAPNGNWVITNVSSPTQFQFVATSTPTGTLGGTILFYTRPEGYQLHRVPDGGVLLSTGGNNTGSQQIRQTRRYFRYQSGKAIQYSTGFKITPSYDVKQITASGTTVTITTLQDHNLQVGATIRIEGVVSGAGAADSAFYNITTTVVSIISTESFTYTAGGTVTDTAPGGSNIYATAIGWKGAVVRAGLFDNQNGFYFEYDGAQLFACKRDSIKELLGTVAVQINNNEVVGTNTRFREQLIVGDQIVIKGQTHEIIAIGSDTSLRISPAYQSVDKSGARYLKTQITKVPQSQWNMDKIDGTGPSGYNLDISKMQMAYIDYTWYGAGYIRFGFRGVNGDIIYCHKMPNNNVNHQAYMRSGNLPARFEAANYGYYSKLLAGSTATRGSALASTDTTMYIESAVNWPTTGNVMVRDTTNCELISYTGIGAYNATVRGYPLTGLTRRTTFSRAGITPAGAFSTSAFTYSGTTSSVTFTPDAGVGGAGTAQVSVQYINNDCAPVISHWGVSVIMDGRYDDDKSLLFTAGMSKYLLVEVLVKSPRPLLAIRIAPSVDNGIGKNYGVREITNRMQLILNSIGIYSQGQFLIEGILNPQTINGGGLTFPTSWQTVSVGSGSLAQVVYFDGTNVFTSGAATATGTFTGGDRIFGFYTENSGGSNYSKSEFDLEKVRDLGTSILSGNGLAGNVNPGFPTGPDILLICARNLGIADASLACRISWTEAQA